jgi:PAS domain S-box-containing protein
MARTDDKVSLDDAELAQQLALIAENLDLRKKLSLTTDRGNCPQSVSWLEKENETLKYQLDIYNRNVKLFASDAGRQEILYKLQYLESIPLPTWSANIKGQIVHWGGAASKTYGYTSDRALGRNFVELFVIEPEKKQANEDLVSIIFGQEGLEHFNLCKDKDKSGRQVYLVTCCFPVFDPMINDIVQAEVSFDLARLEALEEELEDMHRRYRAEEEGARSLRLAKERAVIESVTRELFLEVKHHYDHKRDVIEKRIQVNRERIADEKSSRGIADFHRQELEANLAQGEELENWEADMKTKIARADTIEGLEAARLVIRERIRRNG